MARNLVYKPFLGSQVTIECPEIGTDIAIQMVSLEGIRIGRMVQHAIVKSLADGALGIE